MKSAGIQLCPVNSLLTDEEGKPARYWIPAYQRGYRWTPLQVRQLLDDIWEFIQQSEGGPREAFYCLQPLVVKPKEDGRFEVVDGQQRLTTIYILLTYLKALADVLEKPRFQITFETRGEANEPFLDNIDPARAEENVDFFHISRAYEAVEEWFQGREGSHKLKLLQHLLNDDESGRNVKVIWFELAPQDDPVAAFTRLNVGKIPLTNDELIRALFLRKASAQDASGALALQIAHEWDQLEKALQRDAFWYFLSNKPAPAHNRIGLLFELVASDEKNELLKQDAFGEFHVFSERLASSPVDREWLIVKQTFMALEEWYEDRELFHLVGFLIFQGLGINELLKKARSLSKTQFAHYLRKQVFRLAVSGDLDAQSPQELTSSIRDFCDDLSYGYDSGRVRALLLLFNLATLLDNPKSNIRFQFENFKQDEWDIEHVRSIEDRRPMRHHERREWFNRSLGYLRTDPDAASLVERIAEFLSGSNTEVEDDGRFDPLYEDVLRYFHEAEDIEEHGVGNLVLLDRSTNRSYKNAVFAVKRKRILELDQAGVFVPLCTRNVFLKCYSPAADNVLFWSASDSKAYIETMTSTLSRFFLAEIKEMV